MSDGVGSKVTLRLRMGTHDAHYGGNLVDGARMLGLFGDVATEMCIRTDGNEGLFASYSDVQFREPVRAGDVVEVDARLSRVGTRSRTLDFEARKVIRSAPEVNASAAQVLMPPIVVCKASGTCVTPKDKQRRPA